MFLLKCNIYLNVPSSNSLVSNCTLLEILTVVFWLYASSFVTIELAEAASTLLISIAVAISVVFSEVDSSCATECLFLSVCENNCVFSTESWLSVNVNESISLSAFLLSFAVLRAS